MIVQKHINTYETLSFEALADNKQGIIELVGLDTETTGLDIMRDKPFLIIFGWLTRTGIIKVWSFEPTDHALKVLNLVCESLKDHSLWAWNTKYDMHMMANVGFNVLPYKWADGMGVALLTINVDDPIMGNKGITRLALKKVAKHYIRDDADDLEKQVKMSLTRINKNCKQQATALLQLLGLDFNDVWEDYKNEDCVDENALEIMDNYVKDKDSYNLVQKELMYEYAVNDVIIMLEYIHLALPYIYTRHQESVLQREMDLIIPVWKQERVGIKIDLDYLLASKEVVKQYLDTLRTNFIKLAGVPITSGQHKVIKDLFNSWGYPLVSVAKPVLLSAVDTTFTGQAKDFAIALIKLRTVEKWYSTYILRWIKLQYNGRIYSSFNQFGTVSGRFSSSFQQFPKKALYDEEGKELFHPRKIVIPTGEGYNSLYMLDFSQMELRVQAHYTILTSGGDLNLCRAYMPFKMTPEEAKTWQPTDLHTATALNAFGPDIKTLPNFKALRSASKTVNFACLYGAGVDALMKIPDLRRFTIAQVTAMRSAFYKTFPNIADYRKTVQQILIKHGYVQNMFGRRYYATNYHTWFEIANYLIQGTCADMVKEAMIKIDKFLTKGNYKTRIILSVHDEIVYEVWQGEENLIPILQQMQQVSPWCRIPMISDIEHTTTNWADKKGDD